MPPRDAPTTTAVIAYRGGTQSTVPGKDPGHLSRFERCPSNAIAKAQPTRFDPTNTDNAAGLGEAGRGDGMYLV